MDKKEILKGLIAYLENVKNNSSMSKDNHRLIDYMLSDVRALQSEKYSDMSDAAFSLYAVLR